MSRILVVYYSMSGNTRTVAEHVAAASGADIEAIVEARPRAGSLAALRCIWEVLTGREPALLPPEHDSATYDVVVLGTPVWGWRMSSPVRSYISSQGHLFKSVAVFCTQGGAGGEGVLDAMIRLAGHQNAPRLIVNADQLSSPDTETRVQNFAAELTG